MVVSVNEVQMNEELLHAYEVWIEKQCKGCSEERKRRLTRQSNHAEKLFIRNIWWPSFGQLNNLHAEYEIRDFKNGWRYLDFAFIVEGFKICIEIDGYGTHSRDVNRTQFSDHLLRQNHLVIDGWYLLRFSYDDIVERPRVCQQIVQQLMGKLSVLNAWPEISLTPSERTILRLAVSLSTPITPQFATAHLKLHRTTVTRHLKSLVLKGLLTPSRPDVKRTCSYRINKAALPKMFY